MISARKLFTNRANARASTGPRSAAGKARVSRNARRHGLTVRSAANPACVPEVVALARRIAGPDASAHRLARAWPVAVA